VEFTIHVPWMTRMRRMAIGLCLIMVLVAVAVPASAAPPGAIGGDVTVVNDETNPVPVTVENEVAVTGGNNTPVNISGEVTVGNVNPLEVSGDVSATVQGAVDVNGQTFDTDGNLSVAVERSPVSSWVAAISSSIAEGDTQIKPAPPSGFLTAILLDVREGDRVRVQIRTELEGGGLGVSGFLFTIDGSDASIFSETFLFPLGDVLDIQLLCVEAASGTCGVSGGYAGY